MVIGADPAAAPDADSAMMRAILHAHVGRVRRGLPLDWQHQRDALVFR